MVFQSRFFNIFYLISMLSTLLFSTHAYSSINKTETGILLDTPWKQKVYDYAKENVKHSAWGIAHSERNYQLTIQLATEERLSIDKDVIFATAFLHDIGAIEPHKKPDIDHSIRSIEIAEPLLSTVGFPMQKWYMVKDAILGHMYYAELSQYSEGKLFHDADALDFLGDIGIVRIVSITERHQWAPTLPSAFNTLYQFQTDLLNKLITPSGKKIAALRIQEMNHFFKSLNKETFNGKAL